MNSNGAVQACLVLPWLNEPSEVFVAGVAELTNTILTADEVRDLVELNQGARTKAAGNS